MSRPNIEKMISDLKTKSKDLKEANVQLTDTVQILQKKFEELKNKEAKWKINIDSIWS